MILPSTLHIILWASLSAIGLFGIYFSMAANIWQIGAAIGVGVAVIDGLLCLLKRPALSVKRQIHHNLPVTAWSKVKIKVGSNERYPLSLELRDHCDPDFKIKDQPTHFSLRPQSCATIRYTIFPTKRGHYTFTGADIHASSPLHLWQKKWFYPCEDEIKVFPNFKEIGHYTLLATHHNLSMMGIKKLLKRGEGNEFHQLREYRQGDELQKIDWKATSRHRRLISKEYQDERDQQIVFVLDSGRRMKHVEAGKSLLDQALNSILLLSYVASRQGDAVGLYSFGGTAKWLPPRKHSNSVRALLLGMYDIESSTNSADYLHATQDLLALQNRRSLMIIITNSRAENYDDLMKMAKQLKRKHLVVIADLRERILDETSQSIVTTFDESVRYQALQHYLNEKNNLLKQLQHLGILTLNVTAEQLPAAMVNNYLEIKTSGRL